MNPAFATLLFASLTFAGAVFQACLVAGLPWGAFAWGGAYPATLPDEMRIASTVSIIVLLFIAALVLSCAGRVLPSWQAMSRKFIWGVFAHCAFAVLANAMTHSKGERIIWLPASTLLLVTSIVVARTRKR